MATKDSRGRTDPYVVVGIDTYRPAALVVVRYMRLSEAAKGWRP